MDLLQGMANSLATLRAKEEEDPSIAYLGKNWIKRFLSRHPSIGARYCGQIDRQRAHASNLNTLRDYFRKLQLVLRKYKIEAKDTYNMDEKGFILGFSARSRVICRSYRRNPLVTQDGSRELLTVLECVSADCFVLPAFIVYKAQSHRTGWHGETDELTAKFCLSKNGWTDDALGLSWLEEHFDLHTRQRASGGPRLLIIDGHASHISYEFCRYAITHDIHLISLPAHSTHLLQPLDVGLFGPLQHFYGKAADDYVRNSRAGILKGTFWGFYREARRKAYTKENIKQAFRATGVSPFNPNAVLTRLPMVKSPPQPISSDTGQASMSKIFTTPKTRRDLRLQTNAAVKFVSQDKEQKGKETIAVILRLAHLAEAALTRADLESFQVKMLQKEFAGKKAARTDLRVLSKARIITGADVLRLKKEREEKEALQKERKRKKEEKLKNNLLIGAQVASRKRGKQVKFAEPEEVSCGEQSEIEEEDSFIDIEEFLTPQTGRFRHPIQSPILSTTENPNPRLPDRPLTMRLRTRK
jgi:hypothetical protein